MPVKATIRASDRFTSGLFLLTIAINIVITIGHVYLIKSTWCLNDEK